MPIIEEANKLSRLLESCFKSDAKVKPSDVVRGWLLESDSSVANVTIHDISHAASCLLDPNNSECSEGRSILIALMMRYHGEEMKTEESSGRNGSSDSKHVTSSQCELQQSQQYTPYQQEIESWLLWLAVNSLWRKLNKTIDALSLCAKGINITTLYMQSSAKSQGLHNEDTALHPLLSRLNRYSILIAENGMGGSKSSVHEVCQKEVELNQSHRLASLRSSVNARAELLNLRFTRLKVTELLSGNHVAQAQRLIQKQNSPSRSGSSASDEPYKICHHLYPHLVYHPYFS